MQLSDTSTASERIGTGKGSIKVLEASPVQVYRLLQARSMFPKVSASVMFATVRVRKVVASTNMRSLKREADRDPRADHLARLLVRIVQACAQISPGSAAFTSKADATRCKFLHTGKPGAAATSGSGSSKSGSKGRGKGCRRRKDSSRRPSSKGSRTSKSSSQGFKGSGSKGNSNKPRVPAAVCLLGALIAASTSTPADAASFAFRKEVPDFANPCHLASHVALPVVRFNDSPDYVNIPLRGEARQVHSPSRKYERQFPITNPPKADVQDVKTSRKPSLQLKC